VSLTLPATVAALIRREQLLATNPNLQISAGTGYWQAEIDELHGQTVATRFGLDQLCDQVVQVLAATCGPWQRGFLWHWSRGEDQAVPRKLYG
jgi:hypothetical protein